MRVFNRSSIGLAVLLCVTLAPSNLAEASEIIAYSPSLEEMATFGNDSKAIGALTGHEICSTTCEEHEEVCVKVEAMCYDHLKDALRPKGEGRCSRFSEALVTECRETKTQCRVFKKVCQPVDVDGAQMDKILLPHTEMFTRVRA
mmetsp:Transcript_33203/g.94060  ORF Transcript_33203/g.94060 Transcript_33203/m.94060 type:complete len:145 (-) Transcript_33203:366-800(-)